jgi:hypothetical protein
MTQSDFARSATAESNIDTPKAVFPACLQISGGDGGGFHVAKGKQGASWNPATSRPGTCRGGAFACWHSTFAGASAVALRYTERTEDKAGKACILIRRAPSIAARIIGDVLVDSPEG